MSNTCSRSVTSFHKFISEKHTVKPVANYHPLGPEKAVFSGSWSFNPFCADPFYYSKLPFQPTDSPGVVFAHRSEHIFLSIQFTLMDFRHPGLVGKIRTKRIHPGSSHLNIHGGATSMSTRNYSTMPQKGTATESHILFRFLVPVQPIFTIQTVLQS